MIFPEICCIWIVFHFLVSKIQVDGSESAKGVRCMGWTIWVQLWVCNLEGGLDGKACIGGVKIWVWVWRCLLCMSRINFKHTSALWFFAPGILLLISHQYSWEWYKSRSIEIYHSRTRLISKRVRRCGGRWLTIVHERATFHSVVWIQKWQTSRSPEIYICFLTGYNRYN